MKNKFPVKAGGDAQIVAGGGSPEREVARWWDGLALADREVIARQIYGKMWNEWEWDCPWDELVPIGQQMRLHMHYDRSREAENDSHLR